MDILFELAAAPPSQGIHWPPFNHIFLKRALEAGLIKVHTQSGAVIIGGMRTNPDILLITDKGRQLVRDLNAYEL